MKTSNSNLKSIFIALLILTLTSTITFSQPPQGAPKGPPPIPNAEQIQKQVDVLALHVGLDSIQYVKVLKIYTNHFEEVKKQRASKVKPSREEIDARRTTFENKIKAELTANQKDLYKTFLIEHKKQRKH